MPLLFDQSRIHFSKSFKAFDFAVKFGRSEPFRWRFHGNVIIVALALIYGGLWFLFNLHLLFLLGFLPFRGEGRAFVVNHRASKFDFSGVHSSKIVLLIVQNESSFGNANVVANLLLNGTQTSIDLQKFRPV